MVRGGGGNTIATITFYGIWWFCHDPKRQQTRKQHNAKQERSNMDATTTCDYEYNYHHQCHMSAEMRFSQCLTIGFLLVVVSCHCHKTRPYLPRCVFTAKPVNTMNWSKCFTTYSQTHEYESLLPEKDDARAFTRFAEHQANYNVACQELCFPRIYLTPNGPLCNGLRMPTPF